MPDNKDQVIRKTEWFKKKLLYDAKLSQDYNNFMKDIIDKGYARKVPPHLLTSEPGKTWYIPCLVPRRFHGNGAGTGDSRSRNTEPEPETSRKKSETSERGARGVLGRAEKRKRLADLVFKMADHQDKMAEHEYKKPESAFELQKIIVIIFASYGGPMVTCHEIHAEEYQMNIHLFGAVSSPSCANFAVKRTADDFEEEVGEETANVLRKNFYVDDCLRSEDCEEAAITRIHDVIKACAKGGFSLSKIISNNRRVLETIPNEKRSKAVKSLDLSHDNLPIERALGVQWCVETYLLGFRITLKDKPLTRRGILTTISSVYGPIGIAAPVILQGKKILQELYQQKTDWNDDIPDEYKFKWEKWRNDLPLLENFTIQRYHKPENFDICFFVTALEMGENEFDGDEMKLRYDWLYVLRLVLQLLFVNIPLLVIRLVVWVKYKRDASIFIAKNGIIIVTSVMEIIRVVPSLRK
ncbi:hypothetical protein QZH41_004029 [Actinostola sp. cb2023]|nr:hypothetical protein QZH41_004029 [Actinostola sp. cb2023]